jgi:Pentapeptide repeats (9 copies)
MLRAQLDLLEPDSLRMRWKTDVGRLHLANLLIAWQAKSIDWPTELPPGYWGESASQLDDLRGLEIYGEELCDLDLSFTDLTQASFINCNLTGTSFQGSNLDSVNFSGSNLTSVDFTFSRIKDCKLESAKVEGANFLHANSINSEFSERVSSSAVDFDIDLVSANSKLQFTPFELFDPNTPQSINSATRVVLILKNLEPDTLQTLAKCKVFATAPEPTFGASLINRIGKSFAVVGLLKQRKMVVLASASISKSHEVRPFLRQSHLEFKKPLKKNTLFIHDLWISERANAEGYKRKNFLYDCNPKIVKHFSALEPLFICRSSEIKEYARIASKGFEIVSKRNFGEYLCVKIDFPTLKEKNLTWVQVDLKSEFIIDGSVDGPVDSRQPNNGNFALVEPVQLETISPSELELHFNRKNWAIAAS